MTLLGKKLRIPPEDPNPQTGEGRQEETSWPRVHVEPWSQQAQAGPGAWKATGRPFVQPLFPSSPSMYRQVVIQNSSSNDQPPTSTAYSTFKQSRIFKKSL